MIKPLYLALSASVLLALQTVAEPGNEIGTGLQCYNWGATEDVGELDDTEFCVEL